MQRPNDGVTAVYSKVATKSTQRARISKHICARTLEKSLTNVRGKVVRGGLHDRMN